MAIAGLATPNISLSIVPSILLVSEAGRMLPDSRGWQDTLLRYKARDEIGRRVVQVGTRSSYLGTEMRKAVTEQALSQIDDRNRALDPLHGTRVDLYQRAHDVEGLSPVPGSERCQEGAHGVV